VSDTKGSAARRRFASAFTAAQAAGVDVVVVKWLAQIGAVDCGISGESTRTRYLVNCDDLEALVAELTARRA